MTLPDREKRSGLKDEVLAGEYVLGALSPEANAALAKRMKTDRQFAAMVRRWQENLGHTVASEQRNFSSYMDASTAHALRRPDDKLHRTPYGRFAILSALWNSVRFWRLTTSAALLWAAVLLFSVA
jgi:anti-sigma-K factor RskA